MRQSRIVFSLASIMLIATFTSHLSATTLNSGQILIGNGGLGGSFALSGSGVSIFGGVQNGYFQVFVDCFICGPGTPVGVNLLVCCNDFGSGSATIGSNFYPSVAWGDLIAPKPSVFDISGPAIVLGSTPGVYVGSFSSFTGSLCGTDGFGGPCLVDLPSLNGVGIVYLTVGQGDSGLLYVDHVVYTFTPEPGTIVLLGPVVLGLVGARRRRSRLAITRGA